MVLSYPLFIFDSTQSRDRHVKAMGLSQDRNVSLRPVDGHDVIEYKDTNDRYLHIAICRIRDTAEFMQDARLLYSVYVHSPVFIIHRLLKACEFLNIVINPTIELICSMLRIRRGEPAGPGDPTCITCVTNRASVCNLPCGHQVMCDECVVKVDKCIICRQPVEGIVRPIYSSSSESADLGEWSPGTARSDRNSVR